MRLNRLWTPVEAIERNSQINLSGVDRCSENCLIVDAQRKNNVFADDADDADDADHGSGLCLLWITSCI